MVTMKCARSLALITCAAFQFQAVPEKAAACAPVTLAHKKVKARAAAYIPVQVVKDEVSLIGLCRFDDSTVEMLSAKGIVCLRGESEQKLILKRGSLLIAPEKHIELKLVDADVSIDPGSIVYVRETGAGAAVLSLHDDKCEAVSVQADGVHMSLCSGHAMILTKKTDADFDEANPCPGIWYRSIHPFDMGKDTRAFVTLFSTLSASFISPAVRKIALEDGPMGKKIRKTAAAVFIACKDPVSFRYKLKESERKHHPELRVTGKLAIDSEENQSLILKSWRAQAGATPRGNELIALLEKLNKEIESNSQAKESYYRRGYLYGTIGCTKWAIADLNKALAIDPEYGDAYKERGICHLDLGKLDDALSDLNKAVKIEPNSGDALLARGRLYLVLKKPEAALTDLTECTKDSVAFTTVLPGELPGNYFNAPTYYLASSHQALGHSKLAHNILRAARTTVHQKSDEYLHRFADRPVDTNYSLSNAVN